MPVNGATTLNSSDKVKLPPGASLIEDNTDIKLPKGATLLSSDSKKKNIGDSPTSLASVSPSKSGEDISDNSLRNPFTKTEKIVAPNGVELPITLNFGQSPKEHNEQVKKIQDRVNAGDITPFDVDAVSKLTDKTPEAAAAYLGGDATTGNALDVVDVMKKNATKLNDIITKGNSEFGLQGNPNEILGNAELTSKYLDDLQTKIKQANPLEVLASDMRAHGRDDVNAANFTPADIASLMQSDPTFKANMDRYQSQLQNLDDVTTPLKKHIIEQTAAEGYAKAEARDITINKIAKRLNPIQYKNAQEALTTIPDVSNPFAAIGVLVDVIKGDNDNKTNMLNSIIGQADVELNNSYKKISEDKAAIAHLNGDENLMNEAKLINAKYDKNILDKYPVLQMADMANEVSKDIATAAGQLEGTDTDSYKLKIAGASQANIIAIMQKKGWFEDPKRKALAMQIANNPDMVKDASFFGGAKDAFLEPFKNLGYSIADVSGGRTFKDRLADKFQEGLFPKEFADEETKPTFNILGHDFRARHIANGISNLAGITVGSILTEGLGGAAGLSASASQRLAAYTTFAVPSIDTNLKDSYNFIDNDAQRAAFVTLGAIINGEGGNLLNLGAVSRVPGLKEDFAALSKNLVEKNLTEDATKELLSKAGNKYVDFVNKYGKVALQGVKHTGEGAATMAYFSFANEYNKLLNGDPNIKAEDLLPHAAGAFVDGIFTMLPFGFVRAIGETKNNPNSTYKETINKLATMPDAAEDVFKLNAKSAEDFNYKMSVVNSARAAKNALDATEKETGISLDPSQRSVYVANKTIEASLRDKAEKTTDEAKKEQYLEDADELGRQSAKTLDGLKFTPTLEPLYDLYDAERRYNKAFDDFHSGNVKEDTELLAAKDNYAKLQYEYFENGGKESEVTQPEEKTFTDFDKTLFHEGKLTALGQEMKDRIAKGEDITILTSREDTPENKDFISKTLGIPTENIKAALDAAGKANELTAYNGKKVFYDDNPDNVAAAQQTDARVIDTGLTSDEQRVPELFKELQATGKADEYLHPEKQTESIEEIQHQALTAPKSIRGKVGENLTVELIARNSTEDIHKAIDTWTQKVAGEEVTNQEQKDADGHIRLLEKGLEKKAEIHQDIAAETKPAEATTPTGDQNNVALKDVESTTKALDLFEKNNAKEFNKLEDLKVVQDAIPGEYGNIDIAKAYHTAKNTGDNPELVKAVESILGKESKATTPTVSGEDKLKEGVKPSNETTTEIQQPTEVGSPANIEPNQEGGATEAGAENKPEPPIEPPKKEPVGENGSEDEKYSSVRKEKLAAEIKGAKKLFEQRVPKGWSEVYDSALKNVQDMYPKKSLYEAMKARVTDFVLRLNNKELFNPTSEDLAVFNVLKAETLKRIDEVEGQDSDNNIVRQAALLELDNYNEDLLNIAKVTNPDGEAGRAFGMHQSEVNTNSGLKIRRMELMKANGGEKLSEADEVFVKEQWDKEKELMKQENEARTQQMQDDFNAKIADLQKEYDDKIKKTGKEKSTETKKEKTLSQYGKELADKIRKLKTQKGDTAVDVTFGLKNLAVEAVAQLVEQGAKLADAIKTVLTDDKYKGLSEEDLTTHIIDGIDRQENKEAIFDKLKEFAKENDVTDITPDMVKDNLIRDFVNSHIGEVDQKELLDEATKAIKEILPNATKEKLIEAYLKENEFKQPTKKQDENSLAAAKKELQQLAKKEFKENQTEDDKQKKALEKAIKNEEQKIKDFTQRIEEGNYEEDAPPIKLKKESAELIRLAKQRSTIEETFRKKQHELQEKNKSWGSKIANFIRSTYVMLLISKLGTLGKIATMAVTRPVSEGVRKMTLGKVFKAFFPNMSIAAERGGEGSSNAVVKKSFEAFFRQYNDKQIEGMYDRANVEFEAAQKAYEDYKNNDNPDRAKLKQLENKKNDALIKVQGAFIFKFIGGSSIKDALSALNHRANEIEKQFGHLEGESIKDGNALDKTSYVIGYLGRLHSALKTFSGRASFAAGFMSRLEGAVKLGEDISSPDKILEIANESYLDWERGKYQQGNDISDLWNKWINNLTTGETGARLKVAKTAQFLLKFDVAITRVPVNILHEALVEYTFGLFKSAYITQKETGLFSYKVKNQLKSEGLNPDTPEFKEALRERISQMDSKQAATIARCFSKGGIGLGLYGLAIITGAVHFGIFPHKGQKKKKEENELRADELNPGQVMLGNTKFGETASGIIEHTPALLPSFMGLGLVQAYKDEIDKGRTTTQAAAKSLYTHLQIIEGSVPQSKLIEGLQEDAVKTVTKRMKDLGILDEPSIGKDKIKNYKKGGIEITDDEYKNFKDKKKEEYDKQVEKLKAGKLPENKVIDEKTNKVMNKKYANMTFKESQKALSSLRTKAGNKVKKELFGEEPESSKEKKAELRDAKAEAAENN